MSAAVKGYSTCLTIMACGFSVNREHLHPEPVNGYQEP